MTAVEKKVVINIKRDKDNKPYAKIYYQNGEQILEPSLFDLPTKVFANYIAKKTVTNEIQGIIYSYTEKGYVDRFDISPLTDNDYCIAGSEVGRKHTVELIKRINDAASLKEIQSPVYITDGQNSIILNDELIRRNNDIAPLTKEQLDYKYLILEQLVTEDKGKILYKAA